MGRGSQVFKRVLHCPANDPPVPPPKVNDFFLHALFARVSLSDNRTIEFETKYDPVKNEIELQIPKTNNPCCIPPVCGTADTMRIFDQLLGMKRGPNFKCFINWLIGSRDIVMAATNAQDGEFVPSTALQVWIGSHVVNLGGDKLVLVLPEDEAAVIGHNLKTMPDFQGKMKVYLVWAFMCGGAATTTSFWVRGQATVTGPEGSAPAITVNDVEIPTFNLIQGDVRETLLLEVDNVGSENIIHLLVNRNYDGSPDAKTETAGVVGLRIAFEEDAEEEACDP